MLVVGHKGQDHVQVAAFASRALAVGRQLVATCIEQALLAPDWPGPVILEELPFL